MTVLWSLVAASSSMGLAATFAFFFYLARYTSIRSSQRASRNEVYLLVAFGGLSCTCNLLAALIRLTSPSSTIGNSFAPSIPYALVDVFFFSSVALTISRMFTLAHRLNMLSSFELFSFLTVDLPEMKAFVAVYLILALFVSFSPVYMAAIANSDLTHDWSATYLAFASVQYWGLFVLVCSVGIGVNRFIMLPLIKILHDHVAFNTKSSSEGDLQQLQRLVHKFERFAFQIQLNALFIGLAYAVIGSFPFLIQESGYILAIIKINTPVIISQVYWLNLPVKFQIRKQILALSASNSQAPHTLDSKGRGGAGTTGTEG